MRAQQLDEDLTYAINVGHTRAKIVSQAQKASEYFLKAILFERGIRPGGTHELDITARSQRTGLNDIWPDLAPLLDEYNQLYRQRNIADYAHSDSPPVESYPGINEPEFTDHDVEWALRIENSLKVLAERVVSLS